MACTSPGKDRLSGRRIFSIACGTDAAFGLVGSLRRCGMVPMPRLHRDLWERSNWPLQGVPRVAGQPGLSVLRQPGLLDALNRQTARRPRYNAAPTARHASRRSSLATCCFTGCGCVRWQSRSSPERSVTFTFYRHSRNASRRVRERC